MRNVIFPGDMLETVSLFVLISLRSQVKALNAGGDDRKKEGKRERGRGKKEDKKKT